MRKFFLLSCSLILALVAGCGGGVTLIYDTISPSATQTLDAGQSVTFQATVLNDSSNSGVTWSIANSGPGTLSAATPTSVVYTAPATVTATAMSAVQAIPVKNSLYAAATQINLNPAPSITTGTTLPAGVIGTFYSTQLASTGGTGTLTYSLASGTLPAGLTLSAAGVISGTPTALANSTFTVGITDSAPTPMTVTKIFTLVVTAQKLSVTTTMLPNAVAGTAYSQQLTATGGVTPYTWALASGTLPTGLSLSSTGLLSGTPTNTGSFNITAKVTDTEPVPQTATSVSIPFRVYPKLIITTAPLPQGSVKNAYSSQLSSTGGTGMITWSLASGSALPAGLTLTSSGLISGTPTAASATSITVQAVDSGTPQQTATMTYTLTIVLSTLTITTTSLPQGTIGVTYPSTQLAYSGGNPPVTWAVATGSSLPAGLTLSSSGLISGKPTGPVGPVTFSVTATDTTPATVTQQLSINIVALAALSITTTSVPAANLGTAYSTTLAATGGATPYTWTLAAGTLPPGIKLSTTGVLSGTPLAAGTYNFTAQVTDSQSTPAVASRALTLTVGLTLGTGAGNALLNGSYAFLLQGYKNSVTTGAVAGIATIGSLTFNSTTGTVTGVEDTNASSGVTANVAVTGTYSIGTDGRGLMVLTAGPNTNVYTVAASNISGTVDQSIAIGEFDNSTGATGSMNATGYAKLQTASAFTAAGVKGTYAFGLLGESPCASCATGVKLGPLAAVGLFTADGVSAISAGMEDAGAYATNYTGITFTGSYTTPSAAGRGTLTLTNTGTLFAGPPTTYTYVVINASEMLLMSNASHATTSLLAGDARLQTSTGYTAASLTGALIGYESQGSGGDGSTVTPPNLNATLYRLAFTGSGTATLAADSNRAGTLTTTTATATTYTTAASGRSVLGTGQVLYSYTGGAGFALDPAATGAYPGLVTYEQQVAAVAPLPPLLSGSYGASTLATPVPATDATGTYAFALSSGGVNSMLTGTLTTTLDTSAPSGTLALGTTTSSLFLEDTTGRITVNASGSNTVQGVVYAISSSTSTVNGRAVGIALSNGSMPTVTVLQH